MSCTKIGYKTCIICLSFLQMLIAGALMAAGIAVMVSFGNIKHFAENTLVLVPSSVLISSAVLLVVLGLLGVAGACKENKWLLATFFVFCGVLFILELVGACLALSMKENFENAVTKEFKLFLDQYHKNDVAKDEIDWVQSTLRCCGAVNATDWEGSTLPFSCCRFNETISPENCTVDVAIDSGIPGCGTLLHDKFFANLNIIGGVGLSFAFIQLIALVAVLLLLLRKQQHYDVF